MQNNKISDARIYFISAIHTMRIAIMIFFATCPLLFTIAFIYFIFNLEWVKAFVYGVIGVSTYFAYPVVSSWFEECRVKFKREVDEWCEKIDNDSK